MRRVLPLFLAWSMAIVLVSAIHVYAQTDWLDRRITFLELQNLDARTRVLESDMSEIKLITRSVATAMIAQFAISAYGMVRRNRPLEE